LLRQKPLDCLHGLNTIYLKEYDWFRIDARGNNMNVATEFSPANERLHAKQILKLVKVTCQRYMKGRIQDYQL
jgi:hypothetical protein